MLPIKSNRVVLAELKARMYESRFGLLTSSEALEDALYYDNLRDKVGPFDPAAAYFARMSNDFLNYAEALEQLGR